MAEEVIMFFENNDKSYTLVDQYINSNRYLEYIDSYNYYIGVDKILLFKKSHNEYIIRYNENNVNKMMIVPLQLKVKNFCNYRKCIAIWNKIIELIGTNNPINFVEANDHDKLFITAEIHKNTSFVLSYENIYRCGHKNIVIVLHSVINDCLKTSLV